MSSPFKVAKKLSATQHQMVQSLSIQKAGEVGNLQVKCRVWSSPLETGQRRA